MKTPPYRRLSTLTDAELLDQFDELLLNAVRGDRHAMSALFIGYGPALVRDTKVILGPDWAQDAGDILQDLFVAMLDGTLVFAPGSDRAIPWLRTQLRRLANRHRRGL